MADNKSNAPVASRWIFLSQLKDQELTSKVRFLGCVLDYNESTGRILVEHDLCTGLEKCRPSRAAVEMKLVLETANASCFQKGAWVNVIGYVQSKGALNVETSSSSADIPSIQAILVWNAGAVQLDKYEDIIRGHLNSREQDSESRKA